MQTNEILAVVLAVLEDMKAMSSVSLDVHTLTPLTDYMVVTTGNSSRHVRAIANRLVDKVKEIGIAPIGVESDPEHEWLLVDLGSIVVHIMQPATRDFYNLEKLWATSPKLATA